MTYNFDKKLKEGQAFEAEIDEYFRGVYAIKSVSRILQRAGADRWWEHKKNGIRWLVEYKSDSKAAWTGNAFIETISVDTEKKLGWLFKSPAQILVYYCPPRNIGWLLHMSLIKDGLVDKIEVYKEMTIPNDGYHTKGILVPLPTLRKMGNAKEFKTDDMQESDFERTEVPPGERPPYPFF